MLSIYVAINDNLVHRIDAVNVGPLKEFSNGPCMYDIRIDGERVNYGYHARSEKMTGLLLQMIFLSNRFIQESPYGNARRRVPGEEMPPHLSERLNFRISADDLATILEAALIAEISLSEFIRATSLEAAQKLIRRESQNNQ